MYIAKSSSSKSSSDTSQEKLHAIHSNLSRGAVHLSAVAGAGKTFVALRLVLDELRAKKGQVLFVAPSLGLGFHFVRWLMQTLGICLGLMSLFEILFHITQTNICWTLYHQ